MAGTGLFLVALVASRLHLFSNDFVDDMVVAVTFCFLLCSDLQLVAAPLQNLSRILSQPAYSLYLVHSPIFAAYAAIFGFRAFSPTEWTGYLTYPVLLLLAVSVAFGFGQAFEGPAMRSWIVARLGRLFRNSREPQSRPAT